MAQATPLTSQSIICVSSIDWDFIWQGHQEIMATLARQGNRVLFVENTGVRAPTFRDLPRLRQRVHNWLRGTKGFRQERDNLFVYSPLILPFPYSKVARWMNRGLLLRAVQRWMHAAGFHHPVVWTFLPTPLARDLARAVAPSLTVYYCIDDLASSSPYARRILKSEAGLFREADLVFVTSEKLRERAARLNQRVHLFPFGVDFENFERVRDSHDEIPAELRALPRPIVGYLGGIHQWVDQDLLAALAQRMPEVSFVLVGPPQTDLSRLGRHPNVHLLGARPHEEVPCYVKGFDVGMVPYCLSDYTAHVYPTKLNEYLAMGIPVVATNLPEIRRFNAEHGEVVAVARDTGEFVNAIKEAVKQDSAEAIRRRIEVSRQNSWDSRIAQMSVLIEEVLAARRQVAEPWQESLRRLYRTAQRRIIKLAVGIAAVYLLLFQSPFVWMVAKPLHVAEPPRPADAIVVFAGGVGETGKAGGGGGYQERVKQAVDLYDEGMAPVMIFSSGYTFVFHETLVMRDLAMSLGVPPSAIVLEDKAANTYENVALTRKILDRQGHRQILLVSSPYHMRRALLVFHKVAPEVAVTPTPVPRSQFYVHERGASLEQIRAIFQEYVAIVYYWWKGWI